MSYIQDNLMPNERILFSAKTSIAVFVRPIIMFGLTALIFGYGFSMAAVRGSQPSPDPVKSILGMFVLCFSGIIFLTSIAMSVEALILLNTTEFAVTDRRIIAKTGFIRRHTLEMFLSKVESVSVRQTWLGRLMDAGTVTVTGTGGTKESFSAIDDPVGVRKKINQIIEKYGQTSNQQR